jgi:hypothetical protein
VNDAVNKAIGMLPSANVVGDSNRMGSDGYVIQLVQSSSAYFQLQVLSASTGQPVQLALVSEPKVWSKDQSAFDLWAYDLGNGAQQAVKLPTTWRYLSSSRVLLIRINGGQTHDGFLKMSAPVVGYPAACGQSVPTVDNRCNGRAEGYYNQLKDSRPVDQLDAVPYETKVQS